MLTYSVLYFVRQSDKLTADENAPVEKLSFFRVLAGAVIFWVFAVRSSETTGLSHVLLILFFRTDGVEDLPEEMEILPVLASLLYCTLDTAMGAETEAETA